MLYELARVHRGRLVIAYLLTSSGMVAGLLYPLATGLAINGVLSGEYLAVLWLVGCHAAQLVLTVASKRYDTRVFTRIYSALASTVVRQSRADGHDPARVAARASLSREYTDFLEEDVSRILYAAIALTISLSALGFLQPALAFACLALGGPLLLIGRWLGRRSGQLNKGLNNRLESEVSSLSDGMTGVFVAILMPWQGGGSSCPMQRPPLLALWKCSSSCCLSPRFGKWGQPRRSRKPATSSRSSRICGALWKASIRFLF